MTIIIIILNLLFLIRQLSYRTSHPAPAAANDNTTTDNSTTAGLSSTATLAPTTAKQVPRSRYFTCCRPFRRKVKFSGNYTFGPDPKLASISVPNSWHSINFSL